MLSFRVVVACSDSNGFPTFFPAVINCTQFNYEDGVHYRLAEKKAEEEEYKGPMVSYDESDGPEWLFKHFDWTKINPVKSGVFA